MFSVLRSGFVSLYLKHEAHLRSVVAGSLKEQCRLVRGASDDKMDIIFIAVHPGQKDPVNYISIRSSSSDFTY